jgi:hypothetical protein
MTQAIRVICRLLIVSLMVLPFHAGAGIIGTDDAASAMSANADRTGVLNAIDRTDVASQLQSMGIDPQAAKDRVAAMSDEEVRTLAGQIQSLPAGADSNGWWWVLLIAVGVWAWYAYAR